MPTVLVAEDESSVREFLVESLIEEGFTVIEAANGLEALIRIKREPPDAVLLDLRMPRLGGLDLLRRLQTMGTETRVFIVTGFPEDAAGVAGSPRVAGIFTKPVDMAGLLGALRSEGAPAPPVPAGFSARRVAKVLVVDDDPDTGTVLSDLLTAVGHEAQWVSNSADALRAVARATPDLILLDVLMPGLSGLDALPSLRALAPGVPIVVVSGLMDEALARDAFAHGAFDYVVKPVDMRRLAEVVDIALLLGGSGAADG